MKPALAIQSELFVLKATICGLGAKQGMGQPDKILAALDAQVKMLTEATLLKNGDTNPAGADLLGVQKFLEQLSKQPPRT